MNGLTHRVPAALFAIVLTLLCGSAIAQTETNGNWGIEQLMQSLARVKSATGRFVEHKHLAILNAPLEFSGTLVYTAPSRLEKRILRPEPQTLVLERDRFTIETPSQHQSRTLDLNQYPLIRAFVEGIRSTLAGDLPTLSRFYHIRLEGTLDRWRLSLAPSEPAMQAVVREIRISGSAARINTFEVIEAQGDRSIMTISGDAP